MVAAIETMASEIETLSRGHSVPRNNELRTWTFRIFEQKIRSTLSQNSEYPSWLIATVNKLVEFLYLEENWDTYGARTIDPASIEFTVELILSLVKKNTPQPWVVPTPNGHIQLEWHTKGIDLEVEVISETLVHVSYEDSKEGFDGWDGELTNDFSKLATVIRELTVR